MEGNLQTNLAIAAPPAPPAHQLRVDELVARARAEVVEAPRPSWIKPAPPAPAPSSSTLDHRLAEEIHFVRRHLDLLGDILAREPILLHRHGHSLQSIDLVDQLLNHIAHIIESEDKALAASQVSHGELRARLTRAP